MKKTTCFSNGTLPVTLWRVWRNCQSRISEKGSTWGCAEGHHRWTVWTCPTYKSSGLNADWRIRTCLDSNYHSAKRSETRTHSQPIRGLAFAWDLASMRVSSGLEWDTHPCQDADLKPKPQALWSPITQKTMVLFWKGDAWSAFKHAVQLICTSVTYS